MNRLFIALFVNLVIPLGGMSTDIYLPSLPATADYFGSSDTLVQITVTLFTLGLGVGQIVAGPISDALGRKNPFLFGMLLQLTSVLLILNTSSLTTLIVVRLFQGFGAAFMMVPVRAMLSDVFDGAALKKQYTYITASFALGPIVAPFIGGYLQHYIGWQANFYFVLVYLAFLTTVALVVLKETSTTKKAFSLVHVSSSYITVLKNKLFLTGTILISFFLGYVAIFNVVGPFVIQDILERSAIFYGYIALLMGFAWFSGNMTSRLFFKFSRQSKSNTALLCMLIAAVAMFSISFSTISLLKFIAPIFIMIFCGGFLFPIYVGECLSLFKEQAASANGLLFSSIWIVFSLFSFIAAFLKVYSLLPIASCYLILTLMICCWFLFVARKH
ncbi:Sulfonamide resistance protein [Piscirickettsia salmonis]|uniref:Sugar (And other) transporter family protein n=1 Tax=Piscirickettsia salmonis TaxID=1238 RepID=A0AAC8VHX6_PISSA|nr:MFS transporter [Piscirickettsia salmonis]ALB22825.1 sugar (and other) transporter family protein [Piscirickettsia salmonis]KLV36393.1 sugar (and other) transporter family protein [Piscirickettsia salmonis]QGN98572.1 Sulfonamide resistance protein [Piscirickettsia salmonis]QGO02190.1 Sulfonamide resistance protein [Piscirickettsia salmonis]QGO12879.1 Sulfonamide resistance protein [Piscirickettsia salmonis]